MRVIDAVNSVDAAGELRQPREVVQHILGEVRSRGFAALAEFTRTLDGAELTQNLRVPEERLRADHAAARPEYLADLRAAQRKNRVKPPRHDGRTAKRRKGRFVVERGFAWLHAFRRLPIRHERWSFIHAGCVARACLIIVARNL